MCAYHDALQAGKQKEVHRTPLIWRPQAPDLGSESGNEPSRSIKCGEFLDYLRTGWLLKDFAPWNAQMISVKNPKWATWRTKD
jgi:hypothetical protein